ncbi:M35 family metallo-endopeptidase [Burkholderia sp. BKH01]|nr:M35 family metallo-endopeptidase [Burkholderia pyrrocinia]MCU9954042.1 M35 family metallo-endopeptidase [Burkholderia sp. BKH01]
MQLRDEGADLVEERLKRLAEWSQNERRRVWTWFGANDDEIRLRLITGLTATLAVMRSLGPANFLRAHPDLDRSLGCLPTNKNVGTVAHVCGPDTATHTISIHEEFCTIRDRSRAATSKLSTIIHECTHFKDTFGAGDPKYGITRFLPKWGQDNPEMAIKNADSIAAYVVWLD